MSAAGLLTLTEGPAMLRTALWIWTAAALSGCTHQQLRFNTVHTAHTVHDVYTQQVLDNLAKFVHNRNSLPHFATANAAAADVTDAASASPKFTLDPRKLTGIEVSGSASRNMKEAFTLTPVNDPRKLELMRCAYQRAVGSCTCRGESAHCPDCEKRYNKFYLGKESPEKTKQVTWDGKPLWHYFDETEACRDVFEDTDDLGKPVMRDLQTGCIEPWDQDTVKLLQKSTAGARLVRPYVENTVAEHTMRTGKVTVACLGGPCWFETGNWWTCRRCCACGLVGHYCGTYVWVPECGRDQLTKLTLTILDVAINEPATIPTQTKEVTAYLDAKGAPVTHSDAVAYEVKATLAMADSPTLLLPDKETMIQGVKDSLIGIKTARAQIRGKFLMRESVLDQALSATGEALSDLNISPADAELIDQYKQLDQQEYFANQRLSELEALPDPVPSQLADPEPVQVPSPIPGAGYLQFEQYRRTLTN